jgi:hypothetical protein
MQNPSQRRPFPQGSPGSGARSCAARCGAQRSRHRSRRLSLNRRRSSGASGVPEIARAATPPPTFNPEGTYRRPATITLRSRRYRGLAARKRNAEPRLKAERKRARSELANRFLVRNPLALAVGEVQIREATRQQSARPIRVSSAFFFHTRTILTPKAAPPPQADGARRAHRGRQRSLRQAT